MFGVNTVEEFKNLVTAIKEPELRDGYHNIPSAPKGLYIEGVGTIS